MTSVAHRRPLRVDVTAVLRSPVVFALVGVLIAWPVTDPELRAPVVITVAAIGAVAATMRAPAPALLTIILLIPYLQFVQSWLWSRQILSFSAASRLGYVKEVVLAVAFWCAWRHRPKPLPLIDQLALALVALVTLYTLAPLGPSMFVRYVAGRGIAAFLIVFLVGRWLPVSDTLRRRAVTLMITSGAVVAVLGIWNRWGPEGWAGWVRGFRVLEFRRAITEAATIAAVERVEMGGELVIRVGSVFFAPNDVGFFLLVVIALIGARAMRGTGALWEPVVAVVCGMCILFTYSRSATGLLLLVGLVLAAASRHLTRGAGVAVTTTAALLMVLSLGAADRVGTVLDPNDQSTAGHVDALVLGIGRVLSHPLGSGLGTSAATVVRFDVDDGLLTENFFLRVGAEVGLLGSLAMIAFVVMVLRMLWRRAADGDRDGLTLGALAGLAGVAAGALVLDTFAELAMGWMLWLLVGWALAADRQPASTAVDRPVPTRGEAEGAALGWERRRHA